MPALILIRHGQSTWNLENRFTGSEDVDLTPLGEEEARRAALTIKEYQFGIAFTSVLKRAIRTLKIIQQENGTHIPVVESAALNERMYGDLQGLNKEETAKKFGADQVLLWRRSYVTQPPGGESLKDTYDRVIPFYEMSIEPHLKEGQNVLVVAHGNSLRALMKYLEGISDEDIAGVDIGTGVPKVYSF